jgi:DHA3 family macrolide efflux protein-like MFS transporter
MRQVLGNRPFRRLWIGQVVSILGDFIALFAVQVAIVFRMHGTPEDMTGVMLAFLAPPALIGPVAGVFVDRWDARRTMIASDVARGLLIVMLAFARSLWQVYAVCFAIATVSCFFSPARSVTVPLLVEREGLLAASGLMQQTLQVARLVAPPLASALVAWIGEASCYWADSASFFCSAALLATLCYRRPARSCSRGVRTVTRDLRQGIGFIFNNRRFCFVVLSMMAAAFAVSCFGALMPLYVRDGLHADASFFGVMGSLLGAGTIAGAGAARKLAQWLGNAVRLLSLGLAVAGAFIVLLAALGSPAATLVCVAAIGAGVSATLVAATMLLQGETPPDLRGRVSSSATALIAAAQGVAMAFAGGWATRFGMVNLFYSSAAILVCVALSGVSLSAVTPLGLTGRRGAEDASARPEAGAAGGVKLAA